MKAYVTICALGLWAVSSACAAPVNASLASAMQFVNGLYLQYRPNGKPIPFVYPDASVIADPGMMALLKNDRDKSKGEVGAMDSDPICRCQDWNSIKMGSLRVKLQGKEAASADVVFSDDGQAQSVHFSLVLTKDGWRIHDIGTKDEPSLITYLKTYKY